jgi:hypothetical protein
MWPSLQNAQSFIIVFVFMTVMDTAFSARCSVAGYNPVSIKGVRRTFLNAECYNVSAAGWSSCYNVCP